MTFLRIRHFEACGRTTSVEMGARNAGSSAATNGASPSLDLNEEENRDEENILPLRSGKTPAADWGRPYGTDASLEVTERRSDRKRQLTL
jgi:hypothetical protein